MKARRGMCQIGFFLIPQMSSKRIDQGVFSISLSLMQVGVCYELLTNKLFILNLRGICCLIYSHKGFGKNKNLACQPFSFLETDSLACSNWDFEGVADNIVYVF